MLTRHCYRADRTTCQGGAHSSRPVTARPNPDDVSATVLTRALPTLKEVAEFLELESAPESRLWADRALAYTTAFDSPLDRITGLVLARAWVAATSSARLHRPAGRLRLHAVTPG